MQIWCLVWRRLVSLSADLVACQELVYYPNGSFDVAMRFLAPPGAVNDSINRVLDLEHRSVRETPCDH